ncbi:exported hypothetical protein [Candidatus Nitrospira nitrosa]|uniref:Uncharacterized protein n=1 Tax=Candidatus Nitrospira nitrosa TaxID=1742972 RepID=A0A0S4L9J8_9BACT|nr:exported hypothetical protein [Candidatus Nitrospira nitrosa]
MLARNIPQVLGSAGVALHSLIAHGCELLLQCQTTLCQHAHGTECNREETNTASEQLTITVTQVFP